MSREAYEEQKRLLQIELLKLQKWSQANGHRHVIVFEGRDAAGKGGTIKRFMEHLNPRGARVVALEKPTDLEKSQWYFQRYVAHLPTAGELVLFDRSWYNRAGVERVMGFCTPDEYNEFMRQAPMFEDMLVSEGLHLTKFWFSVSPAEQRTRFAIRLVDPVRQWKFSPMDMASIEKWDRGERGDVSRHRHGHRPMDRGQEQRQETCPPQCDALPAREVRLRREGPRIGGRAGSADRGTRIGGLTTLDCAGSADAMRCCYAVDNVGCLTQRPTRRETLLHPSGVRPHLVADA
jgi:polyphosphate kinase 2